MSEETDRWAKLMYPPDALIFKTARNSNDVAVQVVRDLRRSYFYLERPWLYEYVVENGAQVWDESRLASSVHSFWDGPERSESALLEYG